MPDVVQSDDQLAVKYVWVTDGEEEEDPSPQLMSWGGGSHGGGRTMRLE